MRTLLALPFSASFRLLASVSPAVFSACTEKADCRLPQAWDHRAVFWHCELTTADKQIGGTLMGQVCSQAYPWNEGVNCLSATTGDGEYRDGAGRNGR